MIWIRDRRSERSVGRILWLLYASPLVRFTSYLSDGLQYDTIRYVPIGGLMPSDYPTRSGWPLMPSHFRSLLQLNLPCTDPLYIVDLGASCSSKLRLLSHQKSLVAPYYLSSLWIPASLTKDWLSLSSCASLCAAPLPFSSPKQTLWPSQNGRMYVPSPKQLSSQLDQLIFAGLLSWRWHQT